MECMDHCIAVTKEAGKVSYLSPLGLFSGAGGKDLLVPGG